jgi:hypothetical protein
MIKLKRSGKMGEKKDDKILINNMDEDEKSVYNKVFGLFDKDKGDFIKVDVEEIPRKVILPIGRTIKIDEKTGETKVSLRGKPVEEWDKQEQLQYAVETDLMLHDEVQQDTQNLLDKEGFYFSNGAVYKNDNVKINDEKEIVNQNIENEVDIFIKELTEKEISSMVTTIRFNGNIEEFVNDEKAGEKYLSKEAQIEKIKEIVRGFKNIVIVHSEEELKKLQEDFIKRQDKDKTVEDNCKSDKGTNTKESSYPEIRTQVYIRISEKNYEKVSGIVEKENIKIMANKVKTRDDKSGINMVIKFQDADMVRNILSQNDVTVLQDVDGNIDWEDIKERSNKFENVTIEQLREFQSKNNDKFDYIAFRKDDVYTIFADKKCDIAIGSSGRKTLKQIDQKVEEFKQTNPVKKNIESKVKTNRLSE